MRNIVPSWSALPVSCCQHGAGRVPGYSSHFSFFLAVLIHSLGPIYRKRWLAGNISPSL